MTAWQHVAGARQDECASARTERLSLWLARLKLSVPTHLMPCALFFALGMADVMGVPSPFAVAGLLALCIGGRHTGAAVCGVCLGCLLRLAWGVPMDVGQMLGAAVLLTGRGIRFKRPMMIYVYLGIVLALRTLPYIAYQPVPLEACVKSLVCVGMGICCYPLATRLCAVAFDREAPLKNEDYCCLAVLLTALLTGLSTLAVFSLNMGMICAYYVVLCASACYPGGVCASVGLLCGLSLTFGGIHPCVIALFSLSGFVGGQFFRRRRIAAAVACCASLLFGVYLTGAEPSWPFFCEMAAALVCYYLTPTRRLNRARTRLRVADGEADEGGYITAALLRWTGAMQSLSQAMPQVQVADIDPKDERDEILEKACAGCERAPICWHEQAGDTRQWTDALLSGQSQSVPQTCMRPDRMTELIRKKQRAACEREQKRILAQYEIDLLKTQLSTAAQSVMRMMDDARESSEDALLCASVDSALRDMRFPAVLCYARMREGCVTMLLRFTQVSQKKNRHDYLCRELSRRLRRELVVVGTERTHVLLEEQASMSLQIGYAAVCADVDNGTRAQRNGDSVITRRIGGGRQLLALSDGMGHGDTAARQSAETLSLLMRCIDAEYSVSQALTAVNGMMMTVTGGERFSTVDICEIDLYTGAARLYKLGACATWLLQGSRVRVLDGQALPLGMLSHVAPGVYDVSLSAGNLLLMMSDGVSDVLDVAAMLESILRKNAAPEAQQVADALMEAAVLCQEGVPRDDMTVLCARVC